MGFIQIRCLDAGQCYAPPDTRKREKSNLRARKKTTRFFKLGGYSWVRPKAEFFVPRSKTLRVQGGAARGAERSWRKRERAACPLVKNIRQTG